MLLWFFTVGQAVAFVPVVGTRWDVHLPEQPFTMASTWLGLLLPAVVLTWLVQGRPGLNRLLHRLLVVRRPMRWYVLCLMVVPLTSLAIAMSMVGVPEDAPPSTVTRAVLVGFAAQALLHLATNNLWEELAWTGFVQVRLQERHAPTVAALLTAPLFALQHSALLFDNTLAGGAVIMAVLVVLAVPFRIVMAWVYNRTGSLFLVGLAHAAGNAVVTSTVVGDALVPGLYGRNLGPVHLFAFAFIGIVVTLATRGRLGAEGSVGRTTPVEREAVRHGA
jgi:membrane protease YdiL (CAAX protease family)